MQNEKRSNLRMVARMLTPSASSIIGSVLVMLGIVGFHMLILSGQPDLFLPRVAGDKNDQLVRIYEETILAPLDNIFGNDFMGFASTLLVWGIIGWVVYFLIDFIIVSLQEWRRSDEDIAYVGKNRVIRHPLYNQTVIRIAVRFFVGIVVIISLFLFRPIISFLLYQDIQFLRATSFAGVLSSVVVGVLGWLALLHFYVVLLRLLAFRTRVLGEIIY